MRRLRLHAGEHVPARRTFLQTGVNLVAGRFLRQRESEGERLLFVSKRAASGANFSKTEWKKLPVSVGTSPVFLSFSPNPFTRKFLYGQA